MGSSAKLPKVSDNSIDRIKLGKEMLAPLLPTALLNKDEERGR